MYNLSVVVCCYNGTKVIAGCLESLAAQQTENSFEVIIVDDGSRDNTPEIIESFLKANSTLENPKFTFYQKANEGLSSTRNYGIERTSSGIIAFIDQDAVAAPDWVENIITEFGKSDKLRIVGGPVQLLNSDSECAQFIFDSFQSLEMSSPHAVIGTNMVFSKALFDEDTLFHPLLASRGDESYVFGKMKAKYNVVPEQIATIVVKHETPATIREWLKTRYQVGMYTAFIDRLLNRKHHPRTLKSLLERVCSVFLVVFIVAVLLVSLAFPYALILFVFIGYIFYRRYFKMTYAYLQEFRKNCGKNVKFKKTMLLIYSSIVNIFLADYGYLKGIFKFRRTI